MAKKCILLITVLSLMLCISACSAKNGVPVQRADQLAAAGRAGERYAGMVVTENVVSIPRDNTKKVEQLYVEVGQEVKEGEKLFSYDTDALELDLEKAQLEVEKMTNEQLTYTEQLEKLEKQLSRTRNDSTITRLTLEINTLKTTMMENEYNLKAKDKEIAKLQEMLQNIDIVSPVDGTVRKIDEQAENGVYITVQQSGAFRIEGAINEMSMANGLMVGSRVQVFSRVSDQIWMGTVTAIDTESASQNGDNMYYNYGMMDTMTTSSNYVFYVELDSVEGLLLGQHVYMELYAQQEQSMPGLWIPESFLTDMAVDEQTYEMTAMVWADNGQGKLEKRSVTLGMYDGMTGCYEILSGLTGEDFVADPGNPGCAAGAAVERREPQDFTGGAQDQTPVSPSEPDAVLDEMEPVDADIAMDEMEPVDADIAMDEMEPVDADVAMEQTGDAPTDAAEG